MTKSQTWKRRAVIGATLSLLSLATPLSVVSQASAAGGTAGSLDTTFNAGGTGTDKDIDLLVFGSDDSIYIAGEFTKYNGTAVPGLARLKSDGTLDTSFNPGTAAPDKVLSIAEAADGDVYVGGSFDTFNGVAAKKLVSLNKDGSTDTGFTSQGFVHYASANNSENVRSMLITNDNKIIVSGLFDNYGGTYSDGGTAADGVVKLNGDGSIDSSFSGRFKGQTFTTAYAYKMLYNADKSKITAIGSFVALASQASFSIARMGNDGSRDTSFTVGDVPEGPNNFVRGLEQTSDGKYYVSGSFTKWKNVDAKYLIRINSDGTQDTSFPAIATGVWPENIAVDPKDRLYISGQFGTYGTTPARGLVRLNKDGSVDTSFDTSSGSPEVTNAAVPVQKTYVAISPAGKVIVYGPVESWGGAPIGHIGRIISDAKPGSVTNVKVTISGTTATVSWKLPTTGGTPDTITATATAGSVGGASAQAASLSCTVPGTATKCDIKGLVKGKSYTFSVVTSNGGGSASPAKSAPITIGTTGSTATSTESLPATGSNGALTLSALALLASGGLITIRRRRATAS